MHVHKRVLLGLLLLLALPPTLWGQSEIHYPVDMQSDLYSIDLEVISGGAQNMSGILSTGENTIEGTVSLIVNEPLVSTETMTNGTHEIDLGYWSQLRRTPGPAIIDASYDVYPNKVELTWRYDPNDPPGTERHRIYRDYSNNPNYIRETLSGVTSFSDLDLPAGRQYEYRIQGANRIKSGNTWQPVADAGMAFGKTSSSGTIGGFIKTSLTSPVPNVRVTAYNQAGTGPAWGQSIFLDGTDTITIAHANIFNFLDQDLYPEMTLELWFKPDVEGQQTLLAKGSEWELSIGLDGFHYLYFNVNDAPVLTSDNLEEQAIAVDEWNHVALVREGSILRLYVNGWLASVNSDQNQVDLGVTTASGSNLLIGNGPDNHYFRGNVDELRFWSETRDAMFMEPYSDVNNSGAFEDSSDFFTDINGDGLWGPSDSTEMRRDYNRLFDRVSAGEVVEPTLIACFHMDMGSGETIVNSADIDHNGSLQGAAWSDSLAPAYPAAFTDEDGAYLITNLNFGNGRTFRVVPSKSFHEFDNPYLNVPLNQSTPANTTTHFTVTNMITISGYVTHIPLATGGEECGEPNVEIWVDGENRNHRTDEDGFYLIEVEPGRTLTLTPKKGGRTIYNFFPQTKTFFNVTTPKSQTFVDDLTRTLRGNVTGGACELPLGPAGFATVTLSADNGCFSRSTSVDAGGGYSFDNIAPMAYSLSVSLDTETDYDPDVPNLLEMNTWFQDNGATINIEDAYDRLDSVWVTEEDTVDFNYRSPIDMSVEGWPINVLEDKQFTQNVWDTLDVYVFEHYYGGHCPVDSGTIYIKDWICDRYVDGDDAIGDAYPFVQVEDLEQPSFRYIMIPGLPRLAGDLKKNLEIRATGADGILTTESQVYRAVVLGNYPNQLNFATTAPEIPFLILRRPPGDGSVSQFTETSTSSALFSLSIAGAYSWEEQTKVYLGVETEVNIAPWGVGTSYNINDTYTVEQGFSMEVGLKSSTELQWTTTTSETYTTATSVSLMGDRGTVFVGGAMNFLYGTTNVLDLVEQNGTWSYQTTLEPLFMPDGFATTFIYTRGYVEDYLLPELEMLANLGGGEEDTISMDTIAMEAVTRWNNILDYEDSLKWAADLDENFSFSGGGQTMTRSHSSQSSGRQFFEATLDLDWTWANSLGFEIGGSGAGATIKTGFSFSLGAGGGFAWADETTTSYTLMDDDHGDDYTVDVCTDPVYATPVFRVIAGNSSCPYELWTNEGDTVTTTPRDVPGMTWLSPSTVVNVHPDETAELMISLENLSSLQESRVYYLSYVSNSNIDGAEILINGQDADESAPIPFELAYLGSDSALITVSRPENSDAYEFDGMLLKFAPECETNYAGVTEGFTTSFDVHFARPCTEASIYQPQENWIVNTITGDTLTIVVEDYDLGQSYFDELLVQYSVMGDENWFAVDTLIADTLRINNQLYSQLFWDVGDLIDGVYDIRLQSRCLDGALNNIMPPLRGVVDRQIPEVLGVPEPLDGVLNFNDVIALNFTEPINPESVDPLNVSLTDLSTSEVITDFEVSVSEDRLIITPMIQNRFIENHILSASIDGYTDMQGNPGDSLAWTFTVDRNPVAWSTSEMSHLAFQGSPEPVILQLNNTGSTPQDFVFSGTASQTPTPLPDWLIITPGSGSLNPGGSFDITLDIAPNLNNGEYDVPIYAVTAEGYEPFILHVVSMCPYPEWELDPTAYEFSMNVTARLMLMSTPSDDIYDRVGAFVGNECRGWAQLEYVEELDSYQTFLTVYSNQGSGEEVNFHIWDRTTCSEYWEADTSLIFVDGHFAGTPTEPIMLNANGNLGQTIDLNQGFTWISLYLETEDMSVGSILQDIPAASGDRIIGQEGYAQYSEATGWTGLANLDNHSMYQLDISQSCQLIHVGMPVFADTAIIPLASGWNWVSYLPRKNIRVNEALESLDNTQDDLIKTQMRYAQYVEGLGWIGSLDYLYPNEGFKLQTAAGGSLTYPSTRETENPPAFFVQELPEMPWVFSEAAMFANSMTITGLLESDTIGVNEPADAVAAFVGEELRGLARPVYVPGLDAYRLFLTVFGSSGEAVQLQIWDAETDIVYRSNETWDFSPDLMVGTPVQPELITRAPLGIGDKGYVPEVYSLAQNYPNPFNPETNIGFGIPEDAHVDITVYNLLGQQVNVLVSEDLQAGYRFVKWRGVNGQFQQVPSGVYVVVMTTDSFREVKKMVLLR